MRILKSAVLLYISTSAVLACSEQDVDSTSLKQVAEIVKLNDGKSPVYDPESSRFSDITKDGAYRRFDKVANGFSATVLPLGNIEINSTGALKIYPTPSFEHGELIPTAWEYKTHFLGVGRATLQTLSEPKNVRLNASRTSFEFNSSILSYEHRADGLEQLIKVPNKLPGEGKLKVGFSADDTFKYELSDDRKKVTVKYEDKLAFAWSHLLTKDSDGNTLPSEIRLEKGQLVYIIDDSKAQYPIVIDPLAHIPNTTLSGTAEKLFGISAAGIGDVNGDNFDDIIVAEVRYSNGETDEGRALIFPGSATGIASTAIWSVEGGANFARLGTAVTGIGDINNDGVADFAVGADFANGYLGQAYVYLGGNPVSTTPVFTANATNPQSAESFGGNITAGDYNCDGQIDLAVSAHTYDNGGANTDDWGRVFVFNGDGANVQFFNSTPTEISSPSLKTLYGIELETGNFNGDSNAGNACDDLVIAGSTYTSAGLGKRGRVDILFGGNAGVNTVGWTAYGNAANLRYGFGLGTGDVNADGRDDLVVGGYQFGNGPGIADLFLGHSNSASMSTVPAWSVTGQANAKFGRDVDILDTDANGFGDILVTADDYVFAGNVKEGAAFMYFNGNGIPSTQPLWIESEGHNSNSNYGFKGGSAGDVNNDGFEDVFITAYGTVNVADPVGHVYVYHGARGCTIAGVVYNVGDPDPNNSCQICVPATSTSSFTPAANGSACDDGDLCTNQDVCQAGRCAGVAVVCNDNNECTTDACDPAVGCDFAPIPDGQACNSDNDSCTTDLCNAGACTHPVNNNSCVINNTCYAAGDADPANPCMQCDPNVSKTQFTQANAGASCEDGAFCTENDTCDAAGACIAGPARSCAEAAGPCVDSVICDEASDRCLPNRLKPVGTVCESGNLCNEGTCNLVGICETTNPVDCSALNGNCIVGTCDAATGSCVAVPANDGAACDDGNACTGHDTCANGACGGGSPKSCDDGNECTADSCDPATGNCVATAAANGTACTDDGIDCTADSCQNGACTPVVNAGTCLVAMMCIAEGTADPNNICRVCDSAQSNNDYSNVAAGTECAVSICNPDATGILDSGCDGNGGCINQPVIDCGAYLCDASLSSGAKCFTDCLTDAQCETGAKCSSDGTTPGQCITEKPAAKIDGPTEGECAQEITLDGSASTDPNSLSLTYKWSQTEGPDVLNGVDLTQASITIKLPELMEMNTTFRFQLVVSNGTFDSDPQEWLLAGIACPTTMDNTDMGDDMNNDTGMNDTGNDMSKTDGGDSDADYELRGSGCLCSSTAKYPTDASWLLLLGFFGLLRRKK